MNTAAHIMVWCRRFAEAAHLYPPDILMQLDTTGPPARNRGFSAGPESTHLIIGTPARLLSADKKLPFRYARPFPGGRNGLSIGCAEFSPIPLYS